jgi:hypothetical protein
VSLNIDLGRGTSKPWPREVIRIVQEGSNPAEAEADLANLGVVLSTRFFKSEVGSGHIINEAVHAPACLP